jgi:CDP-glucose 4,6-dehydratase
VFHLAAQPLVRLSYSIPVDTFEINAIGTANVLEGIRQLNKPCFAVMITTDKVYHNNEWVYPYRENDRLGGYDPYSASKACTELVIDSYRNSFFNIDKYNSHKKAIAVGRAGNVIGGGDWAKDRLIPDIMRALSKNKIVEIRNPNAVRPWQHVLEPLLGYLLLGLKLSAEPENYSTAFNFGPHFNDALSVTQMVDLAISCWGKGTYFIKQDVNQPHEAGLLKLDISKTLVEIGWQPKFNASLALNYTVNWYKQYFENATDITEFTKEQIMNFLN